MAKQQIEELRRRFQPAIDSLPSSKRARYEELWILSRQPEHVSLDLPEGIYWPKETNATEWPQHLYQQDNGLFFTYLKSWEAAVIEALLGKEEVECWLRNLPRKPWSLAYWYEASDGTYKPGYPDLVVIRKTAYGRIADLYEPHGDHLSDGWHKAKGLARFADNHAASYGRIAFARVRNNQATVLDFSLENVRSRALRLNNDVDLDNLFHNQGIPIRQL